MSARFEVGELVNITIKGARVGGDGVPTDARHLYVDLGAWSGGGIGGREWFLTLPKAHAKVTVERVAPREWPPQPGDVWEGADGAQFFARTGEDGDAEWLVPISGGSISSYPDEILASRGPLKLAYRRGWTPAPAPAAEPEPSVTVTDRREEKIAGLRELADWFEAHPDVPLPWWTQADISVGINNLDDLPENTDAARRAELLRIAGIVGNPANLDDAHPNVRLAFRGGVSFRAYYIPRDKPADAEATS